MSRRCYHRPGAPWCASSPMEEFDAAVEVRPLVVLGCGPEVHAEAGHVIPLPSARLGEGARRLGDAAFGRSLPTRLPGEGGFRDRREAIRAAGRDSLTSSRA